MVVTLKANEMVLKAGNSTLFAESEKIGGKLILTNQRVYFKSNNGQSDQYDLEILPTEIQEVIFFNSKKIFPNGLLVVMKNGGELKFTVKKRNEIGAMINKMY